MWYASEISRCAVESEKLTSVSQHIYTPGKQKKVEKIWSSNTPRYFSCGYLTQ